MTTSLNGWTVLSGYNDKRLATGPVPNCRSRTLTTRKEALPLFLCFASLYHKYVRPLNNSRFDEFSYRPAPKVLPQYVSDHCSGTAIDLNASMEGFPGSKNASWWAVNTSARTNLTNFLGAFDDIIVWGGLATYGGTAASVAEADWGHFALASGSTVSDVESVISGLQIDKRGKTDTLFLIG